jgi:hypothetical protein
MYINILIIMFLIFIYKMSLNFLLQAVKILHLGKYNDTEIETIYNYLINLDNMELNDYFNSNKVLQYNNDLDFCIEIIDKMIRIFEETEEYEKCQILLNKKEQSLDIMNIKIENYEHT